MPESQPGHLVLSHSSTFRQGLALQLQVYISQGSALLTMDYQSSSRSQKKRSPTGSDTASSSRQALSTTSAPPSLRYFTAAASSSTPYESPYAQDQDRRSQPPSDSSVRSTSRSTSLYPSLSGHSTTRASHSKPGSSSSGDSIYDSPGPRGSRNTTPGGTMSTQRTMSSVSVLLENFFLLPGRLLRFTTSYCVWSVMFLQSSLRAKLQHPCLAFGLSVARGELSKSQSCMMMHCLIWYQFETITNLNVAQE